MAGPLDQYGPIAGMPDPLEAYGPPPPANLGPDDTLGAPPPRPPDELNPAPRQLSDYVRSGLLAIGAPRTIADRVAGVTPYTPMGQGYEAGQLIARGAETGNAGNVLVGGGLGALAALPFTVAPRAAVAGRVADPTRLARARALGFNTDEVLYHGTNAIPFDAFDISRAPIHERAIFLTPSGETASMYAQERNITPPDARRVMPVYIRPGRQLDLDIGRDYNSGIVSAALRRARTEGYDTVRFRRMFDVSPEYWNDGLAMPDQIAVLDPRNIRSTTADFNPAMVGSPHLLHSCPLRGPQ